MCILIVKFSETVKDMLPYWDTIAGSAQDSNTCPHVKNSTR